MKSDCTYLTKAEQISQCSLLYFITCPQQISFTYIYIHVYPVFTLEIIHLKCKNQETNFQSHSPAVQHAPQLLASGLHRGFYINGFYFFLTLYCAAGKSIDLKLLSSSSEPLVLAACIFKGRSIKRNCALGWLISLQLVPHRKGDATFQKRLSKCALDHASTQTQLCGKNTQAETSGAYIGKAKIQVCSCRWKVTPPPYVHASAQPHLCHVLFPVCYSAAYQNM